MQTKADEDFLGDLLAEVDTNVLPRASRHPPKQLTRRTRALSPPIQSAKSLSVKRVKLDSPPAHDDDDGNFIGGMDDDDIPMSDPAPSSPVQKAVERKAQVAIKAEEEDDYDAMEVAQADGIAAASVNMSGSRPVPKLVKPDPYPTPASSSPTRPPPEEVDASAWNNVTSRLNVISSSPPTDTRTYGDRKSVV